MTARAAEPASATADIGSETATVDLGGGVKMDFVLIRPGRFVMGSDTNQADEHPAHEVTMTRPYYIGKYEVTQEQWQQVMGANPSHFRGAKLPVDSVNWNDCQAFVHALRAKTGLRVALPTEAQWEYACRAGTTTAYSWGDDEADLEAHAWYASNSDLTTHPVGQKRPNPWGLHDMHGNVYEWCRDWYSEGPYPGTNEVDPSGPSAGERRVIRGGAWLFVADNLRSSDRGFSPPDFRINEYGFRCVWEISAPAADSLNPTEPPVHPAAAAAPAPVAAEVGELPERLVVNLSEDVGMEFVLIRPGTFVMGSDASSLENERPAHRVTITRPFYLGKYEVTQRQWEALMSRNPSAFGATAPMISGGSLPVENVSWALAHGFLEKLNERQPARRFRLPTEAEWEYACRAGSSEERHFTVGELDDYAWYGANSGGRTHSVGSRKPNAWGVHDMYGNVWEWCLDRYAAYARGDAVDPNGQAVSGSSGTRVLRGGAWNNVAHHLRSSFRHDDGPGIMLRYYGFRCVAEARPIKKDPP